MKSTGEVMGIDTDFGRAYAKSQLAAYQNLPAAKGTVFISVKDKDKRTQMAKTARKLKDLKFEIISTLGTAKFLEENGIIARTIQRVSDGKPNVLDLMKEGKIKLIINTVSGKIPRQDEQKIRSSAIALGIPVITTLPGAEACAQGIEALIKHKLGGQADPGIPNKKASERRGAGKMPELPEVETIKRDLEKVLMGKQIVDVCIHNPKVIRQPTADKFKRALLARLLKVSCVRPRF